MTATDSLLRSFVAIPLPGVVQAGLAAAAGALAPALPEVKWSRKPENLHVTLKFLGPVAAGRLEALGAALAGALAGLPRFAIELRGFEAFPSASEAQILYAGVEDADGRLAATAEVVETVAAGFGLAREARPFAGHVTLGRSPKGLAAGVDARAAFAPWAAHRFGTVAVDEVHVYESQLAQRDGAGSTYVLRGRAPLARGSN
jgi:2'-5' RNA ligase